MESFLLKQEIYEMSIALNANMPLIDLVDRTIFLVVVDG